MDQEVAQECTLGDQLALFCALVFVIVGNKTL